MVYEIRYRKAARKYLANLTQAARERVMDAVDELPKGDIKKLSGRMGYRLIVGSLRVIFDFGDDTVIYIINIAPRGDVYKK
jgi:mRNA interferase RelE/StbE